MGLDCTAYKNLRVMPENEVIYDEYKDENDVVVERYPKNALVLYLNKHFPHAAQDINPEVSYSYEAQFRWRAGSYSGYGQWRNLIAQVAGWSGSEDAWKNGNLGDPFFELIQFSDCEGTLGTAVCQKLLQDFIAFENKYNAMIGEHPYYHDLYQEWKEALTLAADNGAISFH